MFPHGPVPSEPWDCKCVLYINSSQAPRQHTQLPRTELITNHRGAQGIEASYQGCSWSFTRFRIRGRALAKPRLTGMPPQQLPREPQDQALTSVLGVQPQGCESKPRTCIGESEASLPYRDTSAPSLTPQASQHLFYQGTAPAGLTTTAGQHPANSSSSLSLRPPPGSSSVILKAAVTPSHKRKEIFAARSQELPHREHSLEKPQLLGQEGGCTVNPSPQASGQLLSKPSPFLNHL